MRYLYVWQCSDVFQFISSASVVVNRVKVVEGVDGVTIARRVRGGAGGNRRWAWAGLGTRLSDISLVQRIW